ncbi:hypothetical protein LIT25_21375 [Bacillus sp. F19]|nr:hypothetical protein LIT25_21375 [Bacillus sp. F19]
MSKFEWISNEPKESFEEVNTHFTWYDPEPYEVYVEQQVSLKLADGLVATIYENEIKVEKIDSAGLILDEVFSIHGIAFDTEQFDLWMLETMSAADLIFAIARASGYVEKGKGAN